jgi:hypothetical protein
MDHKEVLFKEVDLIQSCISRMANNSFLVKGWLITLIAVALALLPEKIEIKPVCVVGLLIITCFWYLDAFFLKTEKLYRWKYDWIIANRTIGNDSYYLNLDPYNEKMWTPEENGEKRKPPCIVSVMFSKTLIPLYLLLVLAVLFVLLNSCFSWLH